MGYKCIFQNWYLEMLKTWLIRLSGSDRSLEWVVQQVLISEPIFNVFYSSSCLVVSQSPHHSASLLNRCYICSCNNICYWNAVWTFDWLATKRCDSTGQVGKETAAEPAEDLTSLIIKLSMHQCFWDTESLNCLCCLSFLERVASQKPKACVHLFSNKVPIYGLYDFRKKFPLLLCSFHYKYIILLPFFLLVTPGRWLCPLPTSLPQTWFLYLQALMRWTAMPHHWEDTNWQQNVSKDHSYLVNFSINLFYIWYF